MLLTKLLLLATIFASTPTTKPTSRFTRKTALKKLYEVQRLLEAQDYVKAAQYFALPRGVSIDRLKRALGQLIRRREISKAGIGILDKKGKFGPLLQLYPRRGQGWAQKMGVPDGSRCLAFRYQRGEVAFCPVNADWLLVRLDDVGKIN